MELLLALALITTVIIFGALISLGNERQRKAIDELRELAGFWAIQDIRIKRERLAREVRISDPMAWLNRILNKACNLGIEFQVFESFSEPLVLICVSKETNERVILSPLSPAALHRLKREKPNRLSQFTNHNPLMALPRQYSVDEISVLNGGILFDLELPIAWSMLTGQSVDQMDRIWVYRPT
jgi:hypothetical protein